MTSKYEYGIIDFELINRRNGSVLKPEDLTLHTLLKINLASIFKLIREYDFKIPVLLFDTKPYFKSEFISEYKSNRKRYTKEDLDSLNKEDEDYDKQYKKISDDIRKNEIILEAKDYIINNWDHFCIPINYSGLEADDISYLLTKLIDKKSIHLSKDSDWIYHTTNDQHDVLIIKKAGNVLHKYEPTLEYKIPLEFQKVFDELFKSSHNGVDVKKLKLSNEEIYELYKTNELDEDVINRINGMNPLTYFTDEIKTYLSGKINNAQLNPNVDYIKSYNFVKHKEIYDLRDKQTSSGFDDIEELL